MAGVSATGMTAALPHETPTTAADMDALHELHKAEDAFIRYHEQLEAVKVSMKSHAVAAKRSRSCHRGIQTCCHGSLQVHRGFECQKSCTIV